MKTNHRRKGKDNPNNPSEYFDKERIQLDTEGNPIFAISTTAIVDHCKGKHGAARDRAGAKKFVHSRRRRRTRDWLKKQLEKPDDDTAVQVPVDASGDDGDS